jgi:hypothetical protein
MSRARCGSAHAPRVRMLWPLMLAMALGVGRLANAQDLAPTSDAASAATAAQPASGLPAPPRITILPPSAAPAARPLPVEPSVQPTVKPSAESPAVHPFWDRTNLLLVAGVGLFRGLDYASTRNMQARGREEILLPDEVVNNSAGFASLEAAAAATSVGLSYWMHRTGHHSLERWISIVHISATGFGAVRNYCLESKHPAPPTP